MFFENRVINYFVLFCKKMNSFNCLVIQSIRKNNLTTFWMEARTEYPTISVTALRFLMVFITTYLCESTFSTLVFLKYKYRNQLNVEKDLRLKRSSFNPDIDVLLQTVPKISLISYFFLKPAILRIDSL